MKTILCTVHRIGTRDRTSVTLALLATVFGSVAVAQTKEVRSGFTVREIGLSSGYTFVQLPPITLGGKLPDEVVSEDLITLGTAAVEWRRVTPRTTVALDLFGTYTARSRYSKLSAPASDLSFSISRAFGRKVRVETGVTNTIASSEQLAFQPSRAPRLDDDGASPDGSALVRSPNPDPAAAALFVPVKQSLLASDLSTDHLMASSVHAGASYRHSVRLASYFRGSYTTVRRLSASEASTQTLASPDTTTEGAVWGLRYDTSKRTQLDASLNWSRTAGIFADNVITGAIGYGWSGRRWFMQGAVGAALRPFEKNDAVTPRLPDTGAAPMFLYSATLGHRFRQQTLFAHYSRASHDEYGNGGRNRDTGFSGNLQSLVGAWSWSSPRGRWSAQAELSMTRRPGNFSYIYTWLPSVSVARRLSPDVRLAGEVLFDRHGARLFEGFHMSRTRASLTLLWTPARNGRERDVRR